MANDPTKLHQLPNIQLPNIRKAFPLTDELAKYICSPESREDTMNMFRELGKMAREAGIKVVIPRGGPMDELMAVMDNTINQKDS